MGKLEFCERFVRLDGRPIRFPDRPYLPQIYESDSRRLVLRTSRQVEKSTYLANTILYELVMRAGVRILFVCPRLDQARFFVQFRFLPALENSPVLSRLLLGACPKKLRVTSMQFQNGSQLFVRAAYRSADSARGISADILVIDEYQDLAPGTLAVLEETLSHSQLKRTLLVGTPKLLENQLESAFSRSTANEWTVRCSQCDRDVILDERCLGIAGVVCPECQHPLPISSGRWVPRQAQSEWGDGYWINHLMVPWVNYHEILNSRQTYDLAQFKNEVLGLSTTLGEHVVTRAELEACCGQYSLAQSLDDIPHSAHRGLIAGIDWGGGRTSRTVITIGYCDEDNRFVVVYVGAFRADEDPKKLIGDVAEICRRFNVRWIAADGRGNGLTINRLLLDALRYRASLYAIVYSECNQEPMQDGTLWTWTIDRSSSIGLLYSLVRKKYIVFPQVADCSWYLDEMACELAEYDEERRRIRYTKPLDQRDDALHATNYAMLLMNRWLDFAPPEEEFLIDDP